MNVTAQHADGRYICKKDHWLTAILVPARPMGSRVPCPSVRKVYFEAGDRGRPFLLGTTSEREAWPVLVVGVPAFTASWRTMGADPLRTNSWTEETAFDWSTAEEVDGQVASAYPLTRFETLPADEFPFTSAGFQYGGHTYARADLSTEGTKATGSTADAALFGVGAQDLLDDAAISWTDVAAGSMSRYAGWAYLEILDYYLDEEAGLSIEIVYAARVCVGRFDGDFRAATYVTELARGPIN